jgi:hypothetical protein
MGWKAGNLLAQRWELGWDAVPPVPSYAALLPLYSRAWSRYRGIARNDAADS